MFENTVTASNDISLRRISKSREDDAGARIRTRGTSPLARGDGDRCEYRGPNCTRHRWGTCKRVVIVDHERAAEEISPSVPSPAHMTTSYGEAI